MDKEEILNTLIKGSETGKISDGFHTFDELYNHRIELFIALCRILYDRSWKSKTHSDGSSYPEWFVLGLDVKKGQQITYHLPAYRWDDCHFARTMEVAPEFDGHSPADVLERLAKVDI